MVRKIHRPIFDADFVYCWEKQGINKMKKGVLLTIALLLIYSSCKKSDPVAPANTLSATVDGVAENFSIGQTTYLSNGLAPDADLSIFGSEGSGANSLNLAITIEANNTIATGTYTNADVNNAGFISITYSIGPATTNFDFYTSDPTAKYPTTITITSISNGNVQGTFSGQLPLYNGTAIKTITDGKFNLNVKNP